jgi:hypothetical protein
VVLAPAPAARVVKLTPKPKASAAVESDWEEF